MTPTAAIKWNSPAHSANPSRGDDPSTYEVHPTPTNRARLTSSTAFGPGITHVPRGDTAPTVPTIRPSAMPPPPRPTRSTSHLPNSHRTSHGYNPRTWRLERHLGTGGEGTANLHMSRWTRNTMVVKVIRIPPTTDDDNRPREVQHLAFLPKCNRVLPLLGTEMNVPTAGECSIFLEYCPKGDLRHWRQVEYEDKNNKPVPETCIWRLFIQLTQAISFLHDGLAAGGETHEGWVPLIHRDIKPDNVLVVFNGCTYPSFKLADFGCSKFYDPSRTESGCGTYIWQPPELPRIATPMADVWSVGAAVHYLALGYGPVADQAAFKRKMWEEWGTRNKAGIDRNWWDTHLPRKPTHVNVSKEQQLADGANPKELNPQYSDVLDIWIRKALHMKARSRISAKGLMARMVPDGLKMIRKMAKSGGLTDMEFKCESMRGESEESEDEDSSDDGSDEMEEDEADFDEEDTDPSKNYHGRCIKVTPRFRV